MSITWKAQGDANFYTLLDDGHWLARVQLNGELTITQQEAIMNRLAAAPEVLNALEHGTGVLHTLPGDETCMCSRCRFVRLRAAALAKVRGKA